MQKSISLQPPDLKISNNPAVFVFPYDAVDSHIDWNTVRSGLGTTITLIDKNPNPDTWDHDALFDGFYAWVQPNNWDKWDAHGKDWGEGYLNWFYSTMKGENYKNKILVGGVWPGFDDLLASWEIIVSSRARTGKFIRRQWLLRSKTTLLLS